MASIRKRNGKWQAQVRVRGSAAISRSFLTKGDAATWARQMETEADRRGLPAGLRTLDGITVGHLVMRYEREITPQKRGAVREGMAVRALLKHPLSRIPLSGLTVANVANHRDTRLRTVKPSTVNRELAIYQHAFEIARKVWEMPVRENPFAIVQKPRVSDARSRRLESGEWEQLQVACRKSRNPYILPMVEFAIETAMRRSEVLALKWNHVSPAKRTLYIPTSKNGYSRTIPLTSRALEIIEEERFKATQQDAAVFPTSEEAIKMAWRRVMMRCALKDFRYHDLRHEAVSRFFERGLSVPEVALISGHKNYRMLERYVNLRPTDIALKLAQEVSKT